MKINKEYDDRLRQEWDEIENGCSFDVGVKTPEKKFWWRCNEGHRWETRAISRIKRESRCPYCIGRKAITGVNDVATLYPDLAKQFHPTRNGELKLDRLKESSGKKVWWICEKGHEWEAVINTRTKRGYGCPICSRQKIIAGVNDFATSHPELAEEVCLEKNPGVDITQIGGSKQRIVWRCPDKGHKYVMTIGKRINRGDGCPYCAGRYPIKGETDLETVHPEVLIYWDYEKNGLPEMYTSKSGKVVSWKCAKGHEWTKRVSEQVNANECPACNGRILIEGENDILTVYPELCDMWDGERNKKKPNKVKANKTTKHWWICEKEHHSYESNIYNILRGRKCPYCAGKKPIVGENDLMTANPEVAAEWDYEKNKKKPVAFLPKSNCKVYWLCEFGHSWKARISDRTRGTGCPWCHKERII